MGQTQKTKATKGPLAVSFRHKGTEPTLSASHCLQTAVEIQQIVAKHGDKSRAVWFKLVVSMLPCW